jgi:hypothetical protein
MKAGFTQNNEMQVENERTTKVKVSGQIFNAANRVLRKFIKARIVILCTSSLLLVGCIAKYNFQQGIHSFQVQNYRQAFILLKPEAIKGNPAAQYAVGYMYYYGQGVVEDRKQAFYWISAAARAGQPDAITAMKILGPPTSPAYY